MSNKKGFPQWVQDFHAEWGFYPIGGAATGAAGFLGLGKEATWGSSIAATDFVELLSEGMALSIDRFDIKNIGAIYTEPDDMSGIRRIAGDVSMPLFPEVALPIVAGILGNPTVTVVLSGFLHTNTFKTPTADYASGLPTMPFTFEVFRDVTSSFNYTGVVMNTLQIEVAPNQEVRATVGCIGKATSIISKSSPTFASSPVEPFAFDTCSLSIGGTGTALIESFTLNLDNQLDGIPALNATTAIAKIRRTGPQMVNISGTMDFADLTEYNNFLNQTEQAFVMNFTRANSFAMKITLPRVIYTAFPVSMGGRERLTVSFEGKGRYHVGSATAVEIAVTTTSSGF